MDIISALAVSVSLAADAMAVSVCCGLKSRKVYHKTAFLTAALFGLFQCLMSVLGWSIGKVGAGLLNGKENVVSFLILLLLGIKMLLEARKEPTAPLAAVGLRELLLFAIATSMDALALGTVLPTAVHAETPLLLLLAALMIGGITFLLSYGGFYIGYRFRRISHRPATIIGGAMLILLGCKILIMG